MRGTLVLFLLGTLASGCGDDGVPPPPPVDSGIRFDTAPPPDGTVDAPPGDAPLVDGEIPDGSFDAGLPPTCTYAGGEDLFDLGTDGMSRHRRISMAPMAAGVLATYSASREGAENIYLQQLPSSGAAPDVAQATSDFFISREPGLARVGTSYLLSWFDNSPFNFEVFVLALGSDGTPMGMPQQVTDNMLRDESPTILGLESGALIGWVEVDAGQVAKTRPLSATGAPSGAASTVSAMTDVPTLPVLAETSAGTAIAWSQSSGGASHVILQPLTASGATMGGPLTLDAEGNVDGSLDLAVTAAGGIAVFGVSVSGVRRQVRYRTLDGAGMPLGSERVLTMGTETGTGPSVTPFAGGFALAYRALTGEGLAGPTIRLALLATSGEVFAVLDLEGTAEDGGQTEVGVSLDGHVFVGWSERTASETRLHAARVRCE